MTICFSNMSESEDEPLTDSRWSLGNGYLEAFNERRKHYFTPSNHNVLKRALAGGMVLEVSASRCNFPTMWLRTRSLRMDLS